VSAARVNGGRRGVISVPLRLEPVAHCRIVDQLRKLADLPEWGFSLAADGGLWAHAGPRSCLLAQACRTELPPFSTVSISEAASSRTAS
jgi:hypothetical protein